MTFIRVLFASICLSTASFSEDSQRYDQVTWLCTHNAMNASDDDWKFANQTHTITKQLEQGVGALMLDIWKQDGELVLRHGPEIARFLGFKKLSVELSNIHDFLSKNPDRIVTLILESYAPANEVAAAIKKSGLAKFCHTQNPKQPWPTLAKMKKSGKRLVILSDRAGKGNKVPKWYMPVWAHAWETNWQAKTKADLLNSKPRRGKRSNQLFILNHFITKGLPNIADAKVANANPFFWQRIEKANQTFGRKPTFLVVDFYEVGAAKSNTQRLNKRN